jgi:hypothetical protein
LASESRAVLGLEALAQRRPRGDALHPSASPQFNELRTIFPGSMDPRAMTAMMSVHPAFTSSADWYETSSLPRKALSPSVGLRLLPARLPPSVPRTGAGAFAGAGVCGRGAACASAHSERTARERISIL